MNRRRPPKWISLTPSLERDILEDWVHFENVCFREALQFNPCPDQVRAWLTSNGNNLSKAEIDSSKYEHETKEVESDLEIEDAPGALRTIVEVPSRPANIPELASKASKLSLGSGAFLIRSVTAHSPTEPSTPGGTRTSSAIASLSKTPGSRRRSHTTARKFFLAFLHAHENIKCTITLRKKGLRCAHLLPKATKDSVTGEIEWAIGGRFCINSRVNYILLSYDSHRDLDEHHVLIYPTQRIVLEAVDKYLSWLDKKDGGVPWNQENLIDYWPFLRKAHPILSDGHQYEVRYIAVQDPEQAPPGEEVELITRLDRPSQPFDPPYIDFPIVTVFANPIFITLNALQHLDHVYSVQWEQRTTEQSWLDWIRAEPRLSHFRTGSLDQEFALFLNVAAHLHRRLGKDFAWKYKEKTNSPFSELSSNSFSDDTSNHSMTGSSMSVGNADASSARSKRKGAHCGRSNGQANSGTLTALSTSPSDASVIAAAWRAKNIEVDTLGQSSNQMRAAIIAGPRRSLGLKRCQQSSTQP